MTYVDSHSLAEFDESGFLNAMFCSLVRCYLFVTTQNEAEPIEENDENQDLAHVLALLHDSAVSRHQKSNTIVRVNSIGGLFFELLREKALHRQNGILFREYFGDLSSYTGLYEAILEDIRLAQYGYWDNLSNKLMGNQQFLSTLRELGGAYWANWFKRLFANHFQFPNMEELKLHLSLPRELWNRDISTSAAWFVEITRQGAKRLNEARVILLGEKGSGKTSLARRLYNPNADMPSEKESTEGVNITEFKLSVMSSLVSEEQDAMVHVWDFAGHAITHAAHRFFLSERCVYVIVYDGRTEGRNRLTYWLDHVRNYGGNAKVLVLVNLKDGNRPDISENYIQKNYPEHRCEFYYFSIKNGGRELQKFRERLASMIAGDPAWNQQVPSSYYRVKERIEERFAGKRDHISRDEFHEIAAEIPEIDRDNVLRNLTCLGICLWYPQLQNMNLLVLNPEWITKGVYRVINWIQNRKTNAVVSLREFDQIFQKERTVYPQDKHKFLYDLIQVYELAYSDGRKIVVPQCLPQDRPASDILPEFPPETSLSTIIQAKSGEGLDENLLAFPPDVMPRFIVRRSEELSSNKKLIWRFGAVLELGGGTFALIQQDDYAIRLQVIGTDKRTYFAKLRSELLDLLSGYEGLQRYQPTPSYYFFSKEGKRDIKLSDDEARNLLRNIPLEQQPNYYDPKQNAYIDLPQVAHDYSITINNTYINIFEKELKNMGDTYNITIDQKGSTNPMAGGRDFTGNTIAALSEEKNHFAKEIDEAIRTVNGLGDIEQGHKDDLIAILQEANDATQSGDEDRKEACKKNFKWFVKGAGKVLDKALGALSDLATIASFFGLVLVK